jgi:rhodanese-related sulfurtransferase
VLPAPVLEALNVVARDQALAGRWAGGVLGGAALLILAVRQALYGGYSGDLSARDVETRLYKEDRAYLVDIRPEASRDGAGVPDLRQQARPKALVAEVAPLPQALRGAVRAVRELELERTAVRVRGATPPGARVIFMDAGSGEARQLARALTQLGGRRAYTLDGGFKAWRAAGLRVKKDYTASPLTAVTEDLEVLTKGLAGNAQAAASSVVSDPVRLAGLGAAVLGAGVAATQWELVLQEIGVLGIMASAASWLFSYDSVEELGADVLAGARKAVAAAKGSASLISSVKLPTVPPPKQS